MLQNSWCSGMPCESHIVNCSLAAFCTHKVHKFHRGIVCLQIALTKVKIPISSNSDTTKASIYKPPPWAKFPHNKLLQYYQMVDSQPHFCQKISAVWGFRVELFDALGPQFGLNNPAWLSCHAALGPSTRSELQSGEKSSRKRFGETRAIAESPWFRGACGTFPRRVRGTCHRGALGNREGHDETPHWPRGGWAMVGCKRHHEAVLRWAFMWFSRPWRQKGRALGVSSTASLFHVVQPRVLKLQCSCFFRPPFLAPQLLLGYMTRPADSVPGVIRCAPVCNWLARERTGAAAIALV
jgi:hypothetical protein